MRAAKYGFTLYELLISLLVVSIVVGLALPSLQATSRAQQRHSSTRIGRISFDMVDSVGRSGTNIVFLP